MEKNCLVTTYKATVDNPELKVLGELVIKFKNVEANTGLIALQNNPVFEYVKIDKNVQTSDGTILSAGILRPGTYEKGIRSIEAGDYTLRIKSKYEVNYIYSDTPVEMDLNDLQFKETMGTLRLLELNHIGMSDIKLSNIKDVYINTSNCEIPITELIKSNTISCKANCAKGDIASVKEFLPNLTRVSFMDSKGLYGDFKWLGLTNVNDFSTCVLRTEISGNIEDFVAIRREHGQTTGEVSFGWLSNGGKIKFKGEAITNVISNTISWNETTITFNGETITA